MSGLPIADAPLLRRAARRERLLRAALTGTLALLVGAAVVLAARGRDTSVPALAAAGRTTEVVLDLSGSISGSSYGITAQALQRLGGGRAPVGLVLFSDSAEEALPPGTPPSRLLPFASVFAPLQHVRMSEVVADRPPEYRPNPWYPTFTGGTRISVGLAAARRALQRDRVHGRILLISDLGDPPDDRPALRRQLLSLAQAGIKLQVLALPNARASDRLWFRRLEGPGTVRTQPPAPPPPRRSAAGPAFPAALAAVAVLLAIALALHERLGVSLRWRRTR